MTWQTHLLSLAGTFVILVGLIGAAGPAPAHDPAPAAVVDQSAAPPSASPPHTVESPDAVDQAPAGPVAQDLAGPRAATLDEAELARRNGDYDGAVAVLRALAGHQDVAVANEALLQLAVVLVEGGRGGDSVAAARELLGRQLDQPARARATFLLGRAQRATGDCVAAVSSYFEAERLGSDLGPYLDLQIAECHARLNDRVGQADRAAKAAEGAGARLTRVDALEYQVDAALKRGDGEAALRPSEQLLELAGTRSYRAQTLSSIGNIQLGLGRSEQAARAFATVVAELPETSFAATALDSLAGLGALSAVGTDEVGVVHHFRGRHGDAVAALGVSLNQGLSGERNARALYYQGLSLLQVGRIEDGVGALRQAASLVPGSDLAPRAMLRAGRGLEEAGRWAEAGTIYRLAADTFPAAAAGQEAHQRLVYTLFRRGAMPEAVATARELAASGSASRWKGLALFWAGKALARVGDGAQASTTWQEAADLDRDDFGGLRARAILDGDLRPTNAPRSVNPAALRPTDADNGELERWLEARGTGSAALAAEQASDPSYARAVELFRLGLREQARWEIQEIGGRVAKDPARLVWLARFSAERGEPRFGIRYAVEARQASGEPLHALPRIVQRLIYPLPYAELILAHAERRGVDPLLFAALVRQESLFDASARSSANALGLAQVVPPTGQEIARAVGRRDFTTDDLFRPIVSVEFGVYYLATQLNTYGGQIYPALGAYNAGGGNVNRWLRDFGADDPDLFAERVPFAETQHYLHVVYENYRLYQRLYG